MKTLEEAYTHVDVSLNLPDCGGYLAQAAEIRQSAEMARLIQNMRVYRIDLDVALTWAFLWGAETEKQELPEWIAR